MPLVAYVRVKQRETKHELSIPEQAFDEEAYALLDKPATSRDGRPLPPKHYKPLSGAAGRKSAPKATKARNVTEKETTS